MLVLLCQVRYLGLLENVRVRRAGFAHRETYKRFESRYKMVSAATWPRGTGDARASTQTILAELQISGKPIHYFLPTYHLLYNPRLGLSLSLSLSPRRALTQPSPSFRTHPNQANRAACRWARPR